MKVDDELARLRRRRLLSMLGATGAVGLTGCLDGDDADDGEGADGDEDDDSDPEEYRPSDFDFEPEDGFQDDHPDVEVPDDLGGVLVLDGERMEVELWDRGGEGGPLSGEGLDLYVDEEEDEFIGPGPYFSLQAGFDNLDREEPHVIVRQSFVGGFNIPPGHVRLESVELVREVGTYTILYHEYSDGSIEDTVAGHRGHVESPFIKVDRDGVLTAKAEPQDAVGDGELEEGIEFGARIGADWYQ